MPAPQTEESVLRGVNSPAQKPRRGAGATVREWQCKDPTTTHSLQSTREWRSRSGQARRRSSIERRCWARQRSLKSPRCGGLFQRIILNSAYGKRTTGSTLWRSIRLQVRPYIVRPVERTDDSQDLNDRDPHQNGFIPKPLRDRLKHEHPSKSTSIHDCHLSTTESRHTTRSPEFITALR